MSDAEWLRGIADSGWNSDEWSPEVKAMLRRVADRLDATADLLAACEALVAAARDPDEVVSCLDVVAKARTAIARARGA